jgi:hypothetical protein
MEDSLEAMAQIVNGAGEHGTGYLEKDKAGPRVDVGLRGTLKRDKQRCDLHSA